MTSDPWSLWWRRSGEAGLRKVLLNDWDPIGVDDVPEAADEYDSYLPQVAGRLRSGASVNEIASYLSHVRRDWMSLLSDGEADREAAARVSRLMGHANEAITGSVYTHEIERRDNAQKTRAKMTEAFGSGRVALQAVAEA